MVCLLDLYHIVVNLFVINIKPAMQPINVKPCKKKFQAGGWVMYENQDKSGEKNFFKLLFS